MLINGEQHTSISIFDRGLQYGDGVFETLAVVDGAPALLERHMERLFSGCERLRIAPPDRALLYKEISKECSQLASGVLKVIITRGSGGRGYRSDAETPATRIIYTSESPNYPDHYVTDGINLRLCSSRLGHNSQLAGIKHLNRLEQVLARNEWDTPAIQEGVVLDIKGKVVECTMSNIFAIRDRDILTPKLDHCGVAGVMRQLVLEIAQTLGFQTIECSVSLDKLKSADQLFCSNSLIGIWPVKQFEESQYEVQQFDRRLIEQVRDLGFRP